MYAFRIYLTEASGAVLGANFMTDHNVVFDIDRKRVGFAKADCNYGNQQQSVEKRLQQSASGTGKEDGAKGSRLKKKKIGRRRDIFSSVFNLS